MQEPDHTLLNVCSSTSSTAELHPQIEQFLRVYFVNLGGTSVVDAWLKLEEGDIHAEEEGSDGMFQNGTITQSAPPQGYQSLHERLL